MVEVGLKGWLLWALLLKLVFLTAPNRPRYRYDSLLLGPKSFSGILSSDLLLEVLELQERLRRLQVWSPEEQRNVSLRDTCYAPLNPHNASLSDCCINSLLQYFQNNRTHLLLTANQTLSGQTSQVGGTSGSPAARRLSLIPLQVDSKATLGLGGVAVVLGAVMASMGFFSYLGVPSSLVILQVVPFLVLAVGADNIFIFVLEYQATAVPGGAGGTCQLPAGLRGKSPWLDLDRVPAIPTQRLPRRPGEGREAHIGRALGRVAPSMLLCSLSEAICFFLGALTPMPAVRTFALTSGFAVLLDFLLQMSAFVALLSLDSRRQEASRLDVCCCESARELPPPSQDEGLLLRCFRKFYVPFLLHRFTRVVVLLLFLAMFGASLYFMCYIKVGLDQELALPKHLLERGSWGVSGPGLTDCPLFQDSHLLDYFLFLNRYFEVGAPVYFVTTGGYNFSSEAGLNAICSSAGCNNFSLTQKIQYATEFPDESYLAIPASSWVDDFIDWLSSSSCCRLYVFGPNKDDFCPSTVNSLACLKNCMRPTAGSVRPSAEQFHKYLPWFLNDEPNIKCPKGGLAAYSTSVNLGPDGQVLGKHGLDWRGRPESAAPGARVPGNSFSISSLLSFLLPLMGDF
eukprot:bmy_16670T0